MSINEESESIQKALLEKTKSVFSTGFTFAPLLYLSFSAIDWVYSPSNWLYFFFLRSAHLAFALLLKLWLSQPERRLKHYKVAGVAWSAVAATLINIMIFSVDGILSPYYAGLNLVALLAIFFIPYDLKTTLIAITTIYFPYVALSIYTVTADHTVTLLLNLGFMAGTSLISIAIRSQAHQSLVQELIAQQRLCDELESRERIITERTIENIKLKELSAQFSPQVVQAIKEERVTISDSASKGHITAIFVDIVGSTKKVTSLPIEQTQKVISLFTQDCVQTFLKYDLTLDKFLGDGFLAFCNAPINYPNYADRVLFAAFELKERLRMRAAEYKTHWGSDFQIRIGIGSGEALIGFYGATNGFRTYTGLGIVMNKASRLCSQVAGANQIALCEETLTLLSANLFEIKHLGAFALKGFESEKVTCFELAGVGLSTHSHDSASPQSSVCNSCGSDQLFLAQNELSQYVFQCRACGAHQEGEVHGQRGAA